MHALHKTLRALALDKLRRDALGAGARAFLQTQWSEAAYAERFARVVTGDIPADWWMKPADVRYLHGLGLEESEARMMIGTLVENFGGSALQVDHLPELKTELEHFGSSGTVTR